MSSNGKPPPPPDDAADIPAHLVLSNDEPIRLLERIGRDHGEEARQRTADLLAQGGLLTVDDLATAMDADQEEEVECIAAALASHRLEESIDQFDEMSRMGKEQRIHAARIVGRLASAAPREHYETLRRIWIYCACALGTLLMDEDEQVCCEALRNLMHCRWAAPVFESGKLLGHRSAEVRSLALDILGQYGPCEDQSLVLNMFSDQDPVVRQRARTAARKFLERFEFAADNTEELLSRLVSYPPYYAESILDLVETREPERLPEAMAVAIRGENPETRIHVTRLLAQTDVPWRIAIFVELLEEGVDSRRAVLAALFDQPEALEEASRSGEMSSIVANAVLMRCLKEVLIRSFPNFHKDSADEDLTALLWFDSEQMAALIKNTSTIFGNEIQKRVALYLASSGLIDVDTLMELGVEIIECTLPYLATAQNLDSSLNQCIRWIEQSLREQMAATRFKATRIIGMLGAVTLQEPESFTAERKRRCGELLDGLPSDHPAVRRAILLGLEQCQWPDLIQRARESIDDPSPTVRRAALGVLGRHGGFEDEASILRRYSDSESEVRAAARCAGQTFFQRKYVFDGDVKILLNLLDGVDLDRAETILELVNTIAPDCFHGALATALFGTGGICLLFDRLEDRLDPQIVRKHLLMLLQAGQWEPGLSQVLNLIAEKPEAVASLIQNRFPAETRRTLLARWSGWEPLSCIQLLKRVIESDEDADVRLAAMSLLNSAEPAGAARFCLGLLAHSDWNVRKTAVEELTPIFDPALVPRLLPLTRDDDGDVRAAALGALAQYDDKRILGELISSLNDVEKNVREIARALLCEEHGPLPVLKHFPATARGVPYWKSVAARVGEIARWGCRVGCELLGQQVHIYQYRQAPGRTSTDRAKKVIEIEVSDYPLTSGHPNGEDIFRGIILHEIGHHLYDFGVRGYRAMRGIARSEGVAEIYDILRDERLERKLRSRRPAWGVYLDRLNSYYFPQDERHILLERYAELVEMSLDSTCAAIQQGKLPGRLLSATRIDGSRQVALNLQERLVVPGLMSSLMLFMAGLRSLDPGQCPDDRVARALAMVPANLKDLPHSEVLNVARKIGEIIGDGEKHRREFAQIKQRLEKQDRSIQDLIEDLANSHRAPPWMRSDEIQGAPGIRRDLSALSAEDPARPHHRMSGRATPGARSSSDRETAGKVFNRDPGKTFDLLRTEERLEFDKAAHASLVGDIRRHIRLLRSYLERLGTKTVVEYGSRCGQRIDVARARQAVLTKRLGLMVSSREEISPSAYIGLLIDRSASMAGEKIERAKAFGALIAESAKSLNGIEGHVSAFDDDTFYPLGGFKHNAIASLTSGGGNNDSGALDRAARLAFQSRKRHKLLVMISDGSPTECTFESLQHLVRRLTREHNILCAQVAVEPMEEIAFPHFVDLSRYTLQEAVSRFGKLLMQLTSLWRP